MDNFNYMSMCYKARTSIPSAQLPLDIQVLTNENFFISVAGEALSN